MITQRQAAEAAGLATCEQIDECKDWADKAAALASYAKQAEDDALERYATRIRARAIRRAGELLQAFDARGANLAKETGGAHSSLSQRQMAERAGLSEHQQVQAVRVANVPAAVPQRRPVAADPPLAAPDSGNRPEAVSGAEIGRKRHVGRRRRAGASLENSQGALIHFSVDASLDATAGLAQHRHRRLKTPA